MHFYDAAGNSRHTIIGANGKERTTSIRDARKLHLVPSVTTVMDVQAKPALLIWLQQQLLEAAMKTPYDYFTWEQAAWKSYILKETRKKSSEPAARGTDIHNKLSDYFTTGHVNQEDNILIHNVLKALDEFFPGVKWDTELSFCDKEYGFGGQVDLSSKEGIILDFKTKDKSNIADMKQYDDHKMQLAAYQVGLGLNSPDTKRYNLFVSVNDGTPGESLLLEAVEFDKYWNMFYHLLNYWKVKNSYDPCEVLK